MILLLPPLESTDSGTKFQKLIVFLNYIFFCGLLLFATPIKPALAEDCTRFDEAIQKLEKALDKLQAPQGLIDDIQRRTDLLESINELCLEREQENALVSSPTLEDDIFSTYYQEPFNTPCTELAIKVEKAQLNLSDFIHKVSVKDGPRIVLNEINAEFNVLLKSLDKIHLKFIATYNFDGESYDLTVSKVLEHIAFYVPTYSSEHKQIHKIFATIRANMYSLSTAEESEGKALKKRKLILQLKQIEKLTLGLYRYPVRNSDEVLGRVYQSLENHVRDQQKMLNACEQGGDEEEESTCENVAGELSSLSGTLDRIWPFITVTNWDKISISNFSNQIRTSCFHEKFLLTLAEKALIEVFDPNLLSLVRPEYFLAIAHAKIVTSCKDFQKITKHKAALNGKNTLSKRQIRLYGHATRYINYLLLKFLALAEYKKENCDDSMLTPIPTESPEPTEVPDPTPTFEPTEIPEPTETPDKPTPTATATVSAKPSIKPTRTP